MAVARPPAATISLASCDARLPSRATNMTAAPALASTNAAAAPIPRLAPVTIATLSTRSVIKHVPSLSDPERHSQLSLDLFFDLPRGVSTARYRPTAATGLDARDGLRQRAN